MNGINYEFINRESDTAIVLLHGWGMSGDSFNQILGLINNISIIKFDLPGFGKSNSPKDYFDTYEYSYQIFLCLKKIGLKKFIIVGHSFGGRLAILLSSIFDIKIVGLLLSSSAGLNRYSLSKNIKIKIYKFVKFLVSKKLIDNSYLNKFGSDDYRNASHILKCVLRRVVNQDLSVFVKMVNVKTYLFWDRKDKVTPYWICKKIHRYIKLSKIIISKKGGHFVMFNNKYKTSNIINLLT